jgi:predicted RND superfamily exporter protein
MTGEPLSLWRRFLRIGADHPISSVVVMVAISAMACLGVLQLKIDTGADQLMAKDAPDRQAYLHVVREFGSDNRTFIYLHDEHLWSPQKLQALEQLHNELRQLPFVERVDDLFTSPTVRSVDGQLTAQPLLGPVPLDSSDAERVRAAALDDPIAARNLISADGKSLVIGISVREAVQGAGAADVHDTLERVLVRARAQFPALFQVGPARVGAEIRRGLLRDLSVMVPAVALVLAVAVFGFSRSLFAALLPLVIGAVTLLWTFGLMGYLDIPVTLLSAMLPTLVVVIGATGLLRLACVWNDMPPDADPQTGGDAERGRAIDFIERNLDASTLLKILTLALGFAGSALVGIPALRGFGVAAAFAILANSLVLILLLPVLYRGFGGHRRHNRQAPFSRWLSRQAVRAIGLVRHRLAVGGLVLLVLACLAAVSLAPRFRVSHEPLAFFPAAGNLVKTSDRIHEELAGVKVFYITLDANTERAFLDPANLQRLAEIQAFIAKQQVFDRSLSLADIVSQANREAAGGRETAYQVPPSRKLVGQYLLLHRSQDLQPYVSHDYRRANIVVRHNVRDAATLNHHLSELRLAVAQYAGPSMSTAVVGEGVLINAGVDRLLKIQAMVVAAIFAFVLVVMSLLFTSIKGGVVALMPSLIPVLMILGMMRILEMPLNMATALVAVIAIGITVEGTSRLFARYSDLCRNAADYDQAVIETLKAEAAPMIVVRLLMAMCFGAMLLSDFALIAQFGALASVAMLFSIGANLLIIPLVMSRIRLVGLYEILAMSMQREALEGCTLFTGLNSYQIRKTILISELREFKDGECLIEQGTVGRSMFLVVGGQIEVVRHDAATSQRLALLGPGDVFGEIGFVHETYRTADVRALGDVSVLRFDHNRLRRDLALFPHIMAKLNFNISGILGKRLAEMVEAQQPPRPAPHAPGNCPEDRPSKSPTC